MLKLRSKDNKKYNRYKALQNKKHLKDIKTKANKKKFRIKEVMCLAYWKTRVNNCSKQVVVKLVPEVGEHEN